MALSLQCRKTTSNHILLLLPRLVTLWHCSSLSYHHTSMKFCINMTTDLLSIQLALECTVKSNSAFNNNQQIYEAKNPNCTVKCLLRVHFHYLTFSYKGRKP